jgi:hypothetical protein
VFIHVGSRAGRFWDGQSGAGYTTAKAAIAVIRRFLIHVLPDGFHRIRYFGFLCNHQRERKLARCRKLLGMKPLDTAEPTAAR